MDKPLHPYHALEQIIAEEEEDMTQETPQIEPAEYHFQKFIESLGLDIDDEHLEDTPRRVAKAYKNELFRGLQEDPSEHLERTFQAPKANEQEVDGVDAGFIIQDGIRVESMCAHHFLPFRGQAHIGYIPTDKIVGLSKMARVTDGFARRPQVQERLTNQIADALDEKLDPLAAIVVIEAEHECMSCRGVQEPHSVTRTSALRGKARTDAHIKEEFFNLVKNGRSF